MYSIRRARTSDHDAIRELDWHCFPDDADADLKERQAVWWVVEHQGEVVGFAGAKPWRYAGEGALVLHRAGVHRAHRGQGLQRRLIAVRLAYAKREGFDVVWTYTTHRNVVSSNNLIKAGFSLWMPKHWQGSAKPWKPEGDYAFLYWKRKVVK